MRLRAFKPFKQFQPFKLFGTDFDLKRLERFEQLERFEPGFLLTPLPEQSRPNAHQS